MSPAHVTHSAPRTTSRNVKESALMQTRIIARQRPAAGGAFFLLLAPVCACTPATSIRPCHRRPNTEPLIPASRSNPLPDRLHRGIAAAMVPVAIAVPGARAGSSPVRISQRCGCAPHWDSRWQPTCACLPPQCPSTVAYEVQRSASPAGAGAGFARRLHTGGAFARLPGHSIEPQLTPMVSSRQQRRLCRGACTRSLASS